MIKRLGFLSIFLLCMVFAPVLVQAQDTPEKEEDLPLLVWLEYDPWSMVIGADSPRFVLYRSGLVIYWTDEGYQSVQLDEDELAEFLDAVGSMDVFFELDEYYDLVLKTDQPTHVLHVWQEAEHHQVGVYGDLAQDKEVRDQVPTIYLDLYELIVDFSHSDATAWQPEQFEIILWEYETSDAVNWADDWPDFDDEHTVVRESVTSIYLDEAQFEEFQQVVHQQSAVRLAGQTWAFSWRLPFPQEARWMHPEQFEDEPSEDDVDVDDMDLE